VVLKTIYQMWTQFKQYWIAKIFRAESASSKVVYSMTWPMSW
jgi:hypothetical protein